MELQPVGLRVPLEPGENLLLAIRRAMVVGYEQLYAPCGGQGTCGQCRVKVRHGSVIQPTRNELQRFSAEDLAGGYRLACQVQPLGSPKVEVPAESVAGNQQL